MKARLLFIVTVVFFTFFSEVGWSIQNPTVQSPVGSPTVPQSSIRSGLIRSPNPINTSGNLVATGNVAGGDMVVVGGKHFRGVVPYNAISDFGGSPGWPSFDSFLRRSAGSGNFGRYTGKQLTPYFLRTRTVTTAGVGYPGVIGPPTTRISGDVDAYSLPGVLNKQISTNQQYQEWATSNIRFRPMSARPQELQRVLLSEVEKYLQRIKSADEQLQRQEQIEQFRQDLKQVSDRAVELKRDLIRQDSSLLSTKLGPGEDARESFKMQTPEMPVLEEQKSEDKKLDVYEQMKKQADDLQKILEQLAAAKEADESADGEKRRDDESSQGESSQKKGSQADRLAEVSMSVVRAKSILGEHKTFASFSEDKFNQHLAIAEAYLKRGKYYRAADAYTLASIYKPNDPLAYAGKSHALFAAGEYMSSALFLSRALEIFPEYARFKIDLVAMVGDRDKLESRIADVKQWLERNDAAELQFLLGYIYYQLGREERAKEAIEAAYEKMPEASAVITLKEAINQSYR